MCLFPPSTWNSDSSDYDSETDKETVVSRKPPARAKPSSRATASKKRNAPSSSRGRNQRRNKLSSSDESSDDSESSRKKPTRRNARPVKSYKEDSDKTDSDDLIEVDYTQAEVEEAPPDNSETIERVIYSRRGKKGGE
ncbi:chromodomain-helicase-DNA-binding protein 2-like [Diaphorina citri]|uniref:Chromodomain-helicase-DNA-binding protein 2-like n=1 Tax=Diaphorina citri TaxID=121845 RepID=A0A3Q0J0M6_DIACI|nr:chromodomain-helicase-DNA-binding protein 2-like [Diaphorina citri]